MPPAPTAPGGAKAAQVIAELLAKRDKALFSVARSQLPLAEMQAEIARVLAQQGTLTPLEAKALADHSRLIMEAGIRSAAKRAAVLKADPRTWGASEVEQIQQALKSQEQNLLKSVLDRGVNVADDLRQYLAKAQAQGLDADEIAKTLKDKWSLNDASAQRSAEQIVRAGVEQAAITRAKAAGVEEFTWTTVDRFARPEHRARDGKTYRYDAPPDGELPGEPWGCRCFAKPVIPATLKQEQQLQKAPLKPTQKRDPSGLPLLPDFLPPSLQGLPLEKLLKEMVKLT